MKKYLISVLLIMLSIASYSQSYSIKFLAYGEGTELPNGKTSNTGHLYVAFLIDGTLKEVKGFAPNGESFWNQSNLSNQTNLVSYASKQYTANVSKAKYDRANNIQKSGYFIGINDCVSYADDVADAIGLITPSSYNMIVTPIAYIDYLIKNN